MLNSPFSTWPSFSQKEADIVSKVLLSNKVNYWTGEEGRLFESEFSHFVESKYAVAVANGTVALDLSLKALGIGAGDEVIVPPRTFLATVSSVVNAGGVPVFADVDPDTQGVTAESISHVLTENTKAIVVVHLSGTPADMDPIVELAKVNNLFIIEDCAQAHGAKYKGRSVGSLGDIAAWSFCQDKIMTTAGEGGMVTTNNENLWRAVWSFKDHGKSWDEVYRKNHPPGFRWLHDSFGTNWRLTEIQSAVGRFQLLQMGDWSRLRAKNAELIREAAEPIAALRVPVLNGDVEPAWYKCYLFIKPENLSVGWSRDRIIEELNSRGVPCYSGSCSEVYLERAFDGTGWRPKERLPVARELGETSLMFLVHPTLKDEEMNKTIKELKSVMHEASV